MMDVKPPGQACRLFGGIAVIQCVGVRIVSGRGRCADIGVEGRLGNAHHGAECADRGLALIVDPDGEVAFVSIQGLGPPANATAGPPPRTTA